MASFKKLGAMTVSRCSSQPSAGWNRLYATGSGNQQNPTCLIKTSYMKGVQLVSGAFRYVKRQKNDSKWIAVGISMDLLGSIWTVHSTYKYMSGAYEKERKEREKDLKTFKDGLMKSMEEKVEESKEEVLAKYEELKKEWTTWRKEVEDKLIKSLAGLKTPGAPTPTDAAAAAAAADSESDEK